MPGVPENIILLLASQLCLGQLSVCAHLIVRENSVDLFVRNSGSLLQRDGAVLRPAVGQGEKHIPLNPLVVPVIRKLRCPADFPR